MERLFEPIKDLIGALYDLLIDAAEKVWNVAKPVVMIGLLIDLVSGQLGWINQILGYYHQAISYTSGASWLLAILGFLLILHFFKK
jgi:cobalamin biosynthesis protein CobD/CbiB